MKDWFPHDYYATKDLAVIRMLMKHGSRGYGCFWLCTELLHANEHVTRQAMHDVILHTFNDLNTDQVDEVLDDLIRCGLLKQSPDMLGDEDDPEVYSERVLRNKEARELITEHKRRAANTRWNQKNARALHDESRSSASAMVLHNITEHNTTQQISSSGQSVISFECIGQKMFHVQQSELDHWIELYPNVDILVELRKMKGWLLGNNTKRKTHKGMPRFIHNWLGKAQDNGHNQNTSAKPSGKIGERANNFSAVEYDNQIKSIAESAIRSTDNTIDQTTSAIRQTSQTH